MEDQYMLRKLWRWLNGDDLTPRTKTCPRCGYPVQVDDDD